MLTFKKNIHILNKLKLLEQVMDKSEKIQIVNSLIISKLHIHIELAREKFAARFLKMNQSEETIIVDQLSPKFGNSFLEPGQTYVLSQHKYKEGITNILEFVVVYKESATFNNIPAHIFSLPVKINKKSEPYDAKAKKNDKITIDFIIDSSRILEKVVKFNVNNLYFQYLDTKISTDEKGLFVLNCLLRFFDSKIYLSGRLFHENQYNYRFEIENIKHKDYSELSSLINTRYREEYGQEHTIKETETKTPVSVIKKQTIEHKGKIFIIDDETMVTDLLSRVLTKYGYFCIAYNDARGVVEKIATQKPNLVLLDINMPYVDGHTVLRRLKRTEETASIPVVMLTGSMDKADVLDAKEAGVSAYIVKSADMDFAQIVSRIESLISTKK